MSKTAKKAVDAFYLRQPKKFGNTEVRLNIRFIKPNPVRYAESSLFLFDKLIAQLLDGDIWITSAGYNTTTTKDRLNQLNDVKITQKKG